MTKIQGFDGIEVTVEDGIVKLCQVDRHYSPDRHFSTKIITFPVELWEMIAMAIDTEVNDEEVKAGGDD